MRILQTIWPDVTIAAMVFALYHDAGELGSGDIPFPYKARNPSLKVIMDRMEADSLLEQGLALPDPGPEWRWRIKTADLIEMMEKGMDEVLLGNRYGVPIIRGIEGAILGRLEGHEDSVVVQAYLAGRWTRYREAEAMR